MNLLREMEEEGRIRVAKGGHTPVRFGRNNWLMSSSIWKLMKLSVKAAQENAKEIRRGNARPAKHRNFRGPHRSR
jgi:hypothetical protein